MDLFKRLRRPPAGKSHPRRKKAARSRKKKSRRQTSGRRWRWVLGAGAVVVIVGIGLLNWTRTRHGQATLLTLGSQKMFDEVQAAVDAALVSALPGFVGGPAAAPTDVDWPAPEIGAGAAIRCRSVAVPAGESWWEVQSRIAAVVAGVGARVLWGERLLPARPGRDQMRPNEELDLLRLDLGVTGHPTHTLVLARTGVEPRLRWGGGAVDARWTEFAAGDAPTVALIIDDWGYHKNSAALALLAVPAPLTLAVLPDLSYSRFYSLQGTELILPSDGRKRSAAGEAQAVTASLRIADSRLLRLKAGCVVEVSTGRYRSALATKRREIMLHLPMQPQDYPGTDPGPDAVLVGMTALEIRTRLDGALASLTSVRGVNNHMGSAATSDAPTMHRLMELLQDRDLFFVDSLTSARSVAYAEAVRVGVPAARNRIFLDYDNENETAIAANLARLVQAARGAGFAVGIGHPHPATAAVLTREIPRLVRDGVRFVTVSEMMALREYHERVTARTDGD